MDGSIENDFSNETTALCIVFFLLCFLGTGTDEKNLKNYSSYPDEVQNLINEIAEYRGRYKEHSKAAVFLLNFFVVLVFIFHFGTVYQRQQLFAKFCFPDHYGAKSERI